MVAGDFPDTKLVMVGGCRSDVDKQFVEELKALAKKLSIQVRSDVLHGKLAAYHLAHVSPQRQDKVEFRINAPIEDLKELLATCSVGIHTMWNEHFGIGVVEMMVRKLCMGLLTVFTRASPFRVCVCVCVCVLRAAARCPRVVCEVRVPFALYAPLTCLLSTL